MSRLALTIAILTLTATPAAAEYGALAAATDGSYGWSKGYETREEAERRALDECGKYAGDCQILSYFQDACVTIVRNENSRRPHITWSLLSSRAKRRQEALAECRELRGNACKILKEFCTGADDDR